MMRPYSDPVLEIIFRRTYETELEGWLLHGYSPERAERLATERAEYIIKVIEADCKARAISNIFAETPHVTYA